MTTYEGDSAEDIAERIEDTLNYLMDDEPALEDEHDLLYSIVESFAQTQAETSEASYEEVSKQLHIQTAEGDALTWRAQEYGFDRQEGTRATGVATFYRSSEATTDFTVPSGTRVQTADGSVQYQTTETVVLEEGETEVDATIEAVERGGQGNVPSGTLAVMPAPPSGIEDVRNDESIGDPENTDTNGDPLVQGTSRESDDELRQRVLDTRSLGGAATAPAIEGALFEEHPSITSLTIFPNASNVEDQYGKDPFSAEIVIQGGSPAEIAETLKNNVAVTDLLRLQAGNHGEPIEVDIHVSALEEDVTVRFSRPYDVDLEIDVTVTHDGTFIGDSEVTNRLVEYVGGTQTDGDTIQGTDAGEDIFEDRIRNIITDEDTGVIGIGTLSIGSEGESDRTESNRHGVSMVEIEDNEVATLDAENVTISAIEVDS